MTLKRQFFGFLFFASASFSVPAQATVYTNTFEGIFDVVNYCFQPGLCDSEYNVNFSIVYTLDTSLGGRTATENSQFLSGGSSEGTSSPVSAAIYFHGSLMYTVDGEFYGEAAQFDYAPMEGSDGLSRYSQDYYSELTYDDEDELLTSYARNMSANSSISDAGGTGTLLDSTDFGSSLARPIGPEDESYNEFRFYETTYDYQYQEFTQYFSIEATGYTSSYTAGAAVPEPATWLMVMLGLGIVGSSLRRRGAMPQFTTA